MTDPSRDEIREARYRQYLSLDRLIPDAAFEPHWMDDDRFWVVVARDGKSVVLVVDLVTGHDVGPIGLDAIRAAWPAVDGGPAGSRPFDRVDTTRTGVRLASRTGAVLYDAVTGTLTPETTQPDAGRHPGHFLRRLVLAPPSPVPDVLAPARARFATVEAGNVQVVTIADGHVTVLTDDACDGRDWDLESGRRAFGRVPACSIDPWAPDGMLLLASRIDRRSVPTVPTIDFLRDDITIAPFAVEAPGAPLAQQDFFFLEPATGARIPLALGDTRERMIVTAGWMADGRECWFTRFTRDLRQVEIVAVDREGAVRIVAMETSDSFLRIQHDLLYPGNAGLTLLPDSSGYLWLSSRSGWMHLYRGDRAGTALQPLTEGVWPVLSIEGISPDGATVFFTAHSDTARPYDVHLHRVALAGGPVTQLTGGPGQRRISLSPSCRHFIETRSTPSTPPVTEARDADGALVRTLDRLDIAPLVAIGWHAPEEVVVKALDGETDLWGVLYRPADFDPSRRYPVIEHIYAGPQVAYADRSFSLGYAYKPWNLAQAIAQLGYVVVVVDAPGTPDRSKAFQDQVFHAMGRRQIDEHAAALRALAATRPFMDIERTGIYGHSWGGYYALRALADAPDLFKAAVASGSAFLANNVMSEPYLGSDAGSASYAAYDALPLARRIRAPLMIVAGTAEGPMFHGAMRMTHALIEAGVRHELIILPGQPHGYAGPSADYYLEATTRFFQKHLGRDEPRST